MATCAIAAAVAVLTFLIGYVIGRKGGYRRAAELLGKSEISRGCWIWDEWLK